MIVIRTWWLWLGYLKYGFVVVVGGCGVVRVNRGRCGSVCIWSGLTMWSGADFGSYFWWWWQ